MTTYHCTWTRLVPKIRKQGLRCLQTSNWADGAGQRLGNGAVHAFESEWDAIRWAAKMDWDHYSRHVLDAKNSYGKVRILVQPNAGFGQQWIELSRLVAQAVDYACDACARDIRYGGVSDDEGYLTVTGRQADFYTNCALCAAPAKHEITRRKEVL